MLPLLRCWGVADVSPHQQPWRGFYWEDLGSPQRLTHLGYEDGGEQTGWGNSPGILHWPTHLLPLRLLHPLVAMAGLGFRSLAARYLGKSSCATPLLFGRGPQHST